MGFNNHPITSELTNSFVLEFKKFCCTVHSVQTTLSPQKDEFVVKCNIVLPRMLESVCRLCGGFDGLIQSMLEDINGMKLIGTKHKPMVLVPVDMEVIGIVNHQ